MVHRFGVFEFDVDSGELRKNGRAVALEPQPAKALALLLERASASGGGDAPDRGGAREDNRGGAREDNRGGAREDNIVSRDELRDALWGAETHVDFDRGIAYCVSQVRSALGDSGENPRFVQTVPKRGFKFIAPLSTAPPAMPVAPAVPAMGVLQEPHPMSRVPLRPMGPPWLTTALGIFLVTFVATAVYRVSQRTPIMPVVQPVFIGVSIFDNETGLPEHDRLVAGLSDLVVARLSNLDPNRIAVIGNSVFLRRPRNIRNIDKFANSRHLNYLILGQLQQGESGLRFITHFIRLSDQAHLRANRLVMPDGGVSGLEAAVVDEFERTVRLHILNRSTN